MKKIIILIFAFVLLLNNVNALSQIIMRETFDSADNWSLPTCSQISEGMLHSRPDNCYNNPADRYVHNITKTIYGTRQNFTLNWQMNVSGTDTGQVVMALTHTNASLIGVSGRCPNFFRTATPNKVTYFSNDAGDSIKVTDMGKHWNNISIYYNWTESGLLMHNVYLNGTFMGNASGLHTSDCPGGTALERLWAFFVLDHETGITYSIDNLSACNSTAPDFGCVNIGGGAPDTTPPSITYFNLTSSDNGCENWNTDKSNPCSTSSVTPTVQFNTNENAWCAIAGSSSNSVLDKNYTDMSSSRNCTGAASGEGATSHLCTLTNQDEIVYDTSYLFISCKDASNNQNKTSTSGALKLSITGLESAGRNSIGIGIQNALLSGYTNYTDLQIYARNSPNVQAKGVFDRAAKKGSKMWAFNRIGVSDSYVNMLNLTPALYTLELANKTSTNITKQVELLINATK